MPSASEMGIRDRRSPSPYRPRTRSPLHSRYSRRRRRPSQWDVRDPPYGIHVPPPGEYQRTPASSSRQQPRHPEVQHGHVPGPNDIVRAPAPGESGPLAGINIEALKALLSPLSQPASQATQLGPATIKVDIQVTRHARRLYVGNLPSDTTDVQIEDFFNRALIASEGVEMKGNPVVSVYTNLDKRFAFIETRTIREAAAGLALDGVKFREMFLRLRRPNDYNPPHTGEPEPPKNFNPSILGIVSTQVSDGPNKVFIGGIPYNLTEDQIKNLLTSYGPLAAFNLIKEPNTGMSKGFAFFEYMDPSVIDKACEGLNGMVVADKTLTVRRATQTSGAATHASGFRADTGPVSAEALVQMSTRVVQLQDVVTEEELEDDNEYEAILEDMEDEGRRFGTLVEVLIPRPRDEKLRSAAGRIFLRYSKLEEAERAQATMTERRFGDHIVKATFFDEGRFETKDL